MDDFNFFLKLAKPLVLNLPDAKDRTMAALWLKKLCQVNSHPPEITQDNIHVEFLKLLLFVMQNNRLTGIFEKPPPSGNLQDLVTPEKRKAKDMLYLVKTRKTQSSDGGSMSNDDPRVITSVGGDMCEYVAVQEIPNFGIHGYYAISTDPLPKWSNPQSYAATKPKMSSRECCKNTCDSLVATKERNNSDDEDVESKIIVQSEVENFTTNQPSKNKMKNESITRHGAKSLQKMFQAQRSEIAGVETRPCWGRSRYIDRLIDESPHLVADLDLSEADALLHLYRDTKLRKMNKSRKNNSSSTKTCAISSRRREVEMRLDMPPCAPIPKPIDDPVQLQEDIEGSRTCLPRDSDLDRGCMIDQHSRYHSENEDYHRPTTESVGSISLRDYDVSTYDCDDDQYESELLRTTDYGNWRDYAYESGETEQLLSTTMDNEPRRRAYSFNPAMTITNEPDEFREMHRLIADPNRRAPPSRGKIRAPRFKSHIAVDETNIKNESWKPQGNSTIVDE